MHPSGARRNKDDQAIFSNAGPYLSKPEETNKHWYYWCACKDLNLKPPDPKSGALSN